MKKTIDFGKVDYNQSGRKNCRVTIEVELKDGKLSICGNIWNPRDTDCYSCGQNIDDIANLFPANSKIKRIKAIWERWHLNDMKAGSPAQEKYLQDNPVKWEYPQSHYTEALRALNSVPPFTVWCCDDVTPEQDLQIWASSLSGKKEPMRPKFQCNQIFETREQAEAFASTISVSREPEVRGLACDNGYRYGTAWLKEELPAEVIAEVESW